MFVWAVLVGGPLILPLALIFRSELPTMAAEAFLIVGVLTLFLAICATEAVGGTTGRKQAGAD